MSRRLFLAGAVAVAAAAAGAGFYVWRERTANRIDLLAQSLPDADGHLQPFGQWRGKTLIVNFWATWCDPCREEIPLFVRLQERYRAQGVQFVGVAIDQPLKVSAFARDFKINYPVLIGGFDAMDWARKLGNTQGGLPFTVIARPDGTVFADHLGAMTEAVLVAHIGQALR